jgi:hypothetical protein
MRRPVAIAALCTAVLVAPLTAQMRGSFRGSGKASGQVSGGMGGATFWRGPSTGIRGGPGFAAAPRSGRNFGTHSGPQFNSQSRTRFGTNFSRGFRPPWVGPRRFRHRGFYSSFSPYYYYYGYPAYPSFYGDYSYPGYPYSSPDAYPAYDYYADYSAQNDVAQQQDIDRLEGEVARLREQRETPERALPKPPVEIKSTPTLLVFRDRHTQEVQNYAIVGGTLWVFNEQRAMKLPLSWLDVEATSKANDERGVDFRLPN